MALALPFNFLATATTTAAALTSSTLVIHGVTLKAAAANTGKVHVGFSSAVTTATAATAGLELSAGEAYFVTPDECTGNAINIYIISTTGTQNVFAKGM